MTLVDKNDRVLGQATRKACHQFPGKLHRAVLVLIKDKKERILLAKRGENRLWQGVWDGTVATHVYPEEKPETAAKRGVFKELGLNSLPLKKQGVFVYKARWKSKSIEYEVCHLFSARSEGEVKANKKEIAGLRWTGKEELEKQIKKSPLLFSPWFLKALKLL